MTLIRAGYDFEGEVQITLGGAPDAITGWTFKASLILADGTEAITDSPCTVTSVPLAKVRVDFSAAQTAALLPGSGTIEIAILTGTKRLPLPLIAVTIEAGRVLS
jgi:hypothetical protein